MGIIKRRAPQIGHPKAVACRYDMFTSYGFTHFTLQSSFCQRFVEPSNRGRLLHTHSIPSPARASNTSLGFRRGGALLRPQLAVNALLVIGLPVLIGRAGVELDG